MRPSPASVMFLVAAAGACNQSLTGTLGSGHLPTGHGGAGGRSQTEMSGTSSSNATSGQGNAGDPTTSTGTGAITGSSSSAGGVGGGAGDPSICNTLAALYDTALPGAQRCDVTTTGQCQTVVSTHLATCGSCPTHVNDASQLIVLRTQWLAAGCGQTEGQSCGQPPCPTSTNTSCFDVGDGAGMCSYVTTAVAGWAGAPDGSLSPCETLEMQYRAALPPAVSCTAGATGQCAVQVRSDLSPCYKSCPAFVNDATVLTPIIEAWDSLGCGNVEVQCPGIDCLAQSSAACVASDAGGATCAGNYTLP
jgi:hypothetical protein